MFRKRWVVPGILVPAMLFGFGWVITQGAFAQTKQEANTKWRFHTIVDVKFVQQYAKIPRPVRAVELR